MVILFNHSDDPTRRLILHPKLHRINPDLEPASAEMTHQPVPGNREQPPREMTILPIL